MLMIYFISFLSFGFYCALRAQQRNLFPKEFLYIASITFSLVFSYFIFYMYYHSYRRGHFFLIVFCLVGIISLLLSIRELVKNKETLNIAKKFFVTPLLIIAGLLVIYSHFFYSCHSGPLVIDEWGEVENPAFCQIANLPIDNALPFIYAQNVLTAHAKTLVIDWSIADRPPLQIGAVLPILDIEQHSQQFSKFIDYNLFSAFLQLSWAGLVWGALNILLKKRYQIWGLMIGFSTVGFFYINSVFVWPKLLAASLVVFGALLLIDTNDKHKRLFDYRYTVMAATAISLGLLAHTGVVFTLLAMVPVMLYDLSRNKTYRHVQWQQIVAAVFISLLLLIPWQMVKSQLSSSDRLIKWQLAGVTSAKDKRGTLQTIEQQYSKLSFSRWLSGKEANFETMYTGNVLSSCKLRLSTVFDNCNMQTWRNRTFFSTFFAFEFFIFGFLIVIWQLIRNSLDKLDKTVLWISLLTLIVWVLLMFIPRSTVLHQGSYATMILLFIIFARKLTGLPSPVFVTLISLQVLIFYLAWLAPFGIHIV